MVSTSWTRRILTGNFRCWIGEDISYIVYMHHLSYLYDEKKEEEFFNVVWLWKLASTLSVISCSIAMRSSLTYASLWIYIYRERERERERESCFPYEFDCANCMEMYLLMGLLRFPYWLGDWVWVFNIGLVFLNNVWLSILWPTHY